MNVFKPAGLLLFIGLALISCQKELDVLPLGGDVQLTDQEGQPFSLSNNPQVTWVFFGFTSCPDICPGTLSRLAGAEQKLGQEVRVVLITVDPRRDTPATLKKYLERFQFKSALGLTGSLAEIEAAAKKYGVFFDQTNPDQIAHQKNVFLLDGQNRLRHIFRGAETSEEIASITARVFP